MFLRDRNITAKPERSQRSQDLLSSKMLRPLVQKYIFQGLCTAADLETHSVKQLVNMRKWQ